MSDPHSSILDFMLKHGDDVYFNHESMIGKDFLQHADPPKLTAFEAYDIAAEYFPDDECIYAGVADGLYYFRFQPERVKGTGDIVPDQYVIVGEDGKIYPAAISEMRDFLKKLEELDPSEYKGQVQHYGRQGMHWYQHIFGDEDPRAAYNRKSSDVETHGLLLAPLAVTLAVNAAAAIKRKHDIQKAEESQGYKMTGPLEKHTKDGKDLLKNCPKADEKWKNPDGTYAIPYKLTNPDFYKSAVYSNNCAACTATTELQRRGYLVEAAPRYGISSTDIRENLFKGATQEAFRAEKNWGALGASPKNILKMRADVKDYMSKLPTGARGDFSYEGHNYAHSIYFEKIEPTKNNKNGIRIIDAQSSKVYDTDLSLETGVFAECEKSVFVTRYDTATPNEDYISNVSRPMREKNRQAYSSMKDDDRRVIHSDETASWLEACVNATLSGW